MTCFFLLFLALVMVLFTAELTPPIQNAFVIPFTSGIAQLSVGLMQLWDDGVLSQGKAIWDATSGFPVSIEAGCNGIEAGIVLGAAIGAYPTVWREKLLGIVIGIVTVQALNLAWIVTLFRAMESDGVQVGASLYLAGADYAGCPDCFSPLAPLALQPQPWRRPSTRVRAHINPPERLYKD